MDTPEWAQSLSTLIFAIAFLIPLFFALRFTIACFRKKESRRLLLDIIHIYPAIIIIFACIYYLLSVDADYRDAYNKLNLYKYQYEQKKRWEDFEIQKVADIRAFKGIRPRLWSGVDYIDYRQAIGYPYSPDQYREHFASTSFEEYSLEQIKRNIEWDLQKFPKGHLITFQSQNKGEVFFECLYFSVITIATVGYGDITPAQWFTKITVILEIGIGIAIFIFAFGFLMNRWNKQ